MCLCARTDQQFFAAGVFAALHQHAASDAVFVPFGSVKPRERPDSKWEYTLRSLSARSAAELQNGTQAVLTAKCTCFERLVAYTGGFSPYDAKRSQASITAFRHASLRNARLVVGPSWSSTSAVVDERDILFILRRAKRRVITNEADVLRRASAAQLRLRGVVFEGMPIAEQMLTTSKATILIGVHGAGLAGYVAFLPSDARKTACVEIRPKPTVGSNAWVPIVASLAKGAGVRLFPLTANHAPGCPADASEAEWKRCPAGRDRGLCRREVTRKGSFEGNSVLWCNVTVDTEQLLTVIEAAVRHTSG